MRVIAQHDFHDNLKNIDRKRGEEFIVTRERFEQINEVGMEKLGGPLVIETAADPAPAKQTPEKRAASRKRAAKSAK